MKKVTKIAKTVNLNRPKEPNNDNFSGTFRNLTRYLLRGIGIGFLFEGTFNILGFEDRIVRGVTSKQLGKVYFI